MKRETPEEIAARLRATPRDRIALLVEELAENGEPSSSWLPQDSADDPIANAWARSMDPAAMIDLVAMIDTKEATALLVALGFAKAGEATRGFNKEQIHEICWYSLFGSNEEYERRLADRIRAQVQRPPTLASLRRVPDS